MKRVRLVVKVAAKARPGAAIDRAGRNPLRKHFLRTDSVMHPMLTVRGGTVPGGVAALYQVRRSSVRGSCAAGCACDLARRKWVEVCDSSCDRLVAVEAEVVGGDGVVAVVGRGGSIAECHRCGRHGMGDSWKRMWALVK